jgi:hypothetical protein
MDGIGAISLSEASEVVFYIDTYKGQLFANIRKFIKSRKYTGPTKSGIKLTAEQLKLLTSALNQITGNLENLQEQKLIEIPIDKNRYIVASINLFNGKYGVDIRQYISSEKYKGPSKKGVRIPLYQLQETMITCNKMLAALDKSERETTLFGSRDKGSKLQGEKKQDEKVKGVPDEYQRYFE